MNPRRSIYQSAPGYPRTSLSPFPQERASMGLTNSIRKEPAPNHSPESPSMEIINRALEAIRMSNSEGLATNAPFVIKPDQKSVLGTINAFLNSLNFPGMESVCIGIQDIPEVFKSLRYPQAINKNLFNPVGARHTWAQCLAVIAWLGELVLIYLQKDEETESKMKAVFEDPLEAMILQAFMSGEEDYSMIREYANTRKREVESQIKDRAELMDSINLAISVEKKQRDLASVQEDLRRCQLTEFREVQLVAKGRQEIAEEEEMIARKAEELESLKKKAAQTQQDLERKILQRDNQEFTVEQTRAMEKELVEMESRVSAVKAEKAKSAEEFQQMMREKVKANLNRVKAQFKRSQQEVESNHILSEFGVLPDLGINQEAIMEWACSLDSNDRSLQDKVFTSLADNMRKVQEFRKRAETERDGLKATLEAARKASSELEQTARQKSLRNARSKNALQAKKIELERMRTEIYSKEMRLKTLDAQMEALEVEQANICDRMEETFKSFVEKTESVNALTDSLARMRKKWEIAEVQLIAQAKRIAEKIGSRMSIILALFKSLNKEIVEKNKDFNKRMDEYYSKQ